MPADPPPPPPPPGPPQGADDTKKTTWGPSLSVMSYSLPTLLSNKDLKVLQNHYSKIKPQRNNSPFNFNQIKPHIRNT